MERWREKFHWKIGSFHRNFWIRIIQSCDDFGWNHQVPTTSQSIFESDRIPVTVCLLLSPGREGETKRKPLGSQVVVMTFSWHAKDATRVLGRPGNTWQCLFVRLYNLLVCRYDSISHCKIWESTNHWPRHVDSVSFSRMDFVCTSWLVGYHHNKKDFGTTTSVRLHWSPVQNLEAR